MKIHEIIKESNLTEATFDLDRQVDFIWDNYFKEYSESILSGGKPSLKPKQILSSDLPSNDVIDKANEMNQVFISLHNMKGNSYVPSKRLINLNFNEQALGFVNDQGGLDAASKLLKDNGQEKKSKLLRQEFTEERVKGTIHHELSHWLDDTIHNRHISKRLDKANAQELNKGNVTVKQGQPDVALTNFERDAQIHSIKELKRKYPEKWDTLTFEQMIDLNPSLELIYTEGKKRGWYDKWAKMIKRRMHREGLLGKNMK